MKNKDMQDWMEKYMSDPESQKLKYSEEHENLCSIECDCGKVITIDELLDKYGPEGVYKLGELFIQKSIEHVQYSIEDIKYK